MEGESLPEGAYEVHHAATGSNTWTEETLEVEWVNPNERQTISPMEMLVLPELPQLPEKPLEVNPNGHVFRIIFEPEEFPEFTKYEGVLFEVNEEHFPFDTELYKVEWDKMELDRIPGSDEYRFRMIKLDTTVNLVVYPVYGGDDYQKAYSKYLAQETEYEQVMAERKRLLEEAEAQAAKNQKATPARWKINANKLGFVAFGKSK